MHCTFKFIACTYMNEFVQIDLLFTSSSPVKEKKGLQILSDQTEYLDTCICSNITIDDYYYTCVCIVNTVSPDGEKSYRRL